jgi:flavin reductase
MSWSDPRSDDAMEGALRAVAQGAIPAVEPPSFREAMSKLGAAVNVVTTDGAGGKTGFTATALCSVSDQPPTLLLCLNRGSNSARVLQSNRVLCVNTLRAAERATADVFAGRTGVKAGDRFRVGEWTTLRTGSPVLESAIVAFDCRVIDIKPVASHDVYFCLVEAIRFGVDGSALLYHERIYKQI